MVFFRPVRPKMRYIDKSFITTNLASRIISLGTRYWMRHIFVFHHAKPFVVSEAYAALENVYGFIKRRWFALISISREDPVRLIPSNPLHFFRPRIIAVDIGNLRPVLRRWRVHSPNSLTQASRCAAELARKSRNSLAWLWFTNIHQTGPHTDLSHLVLGLSEGFHH